LEVPGIPGADRAITHGAMPTTKSMKEVASGLAERLKPKITHVSHSSYPWLFVPAEEDDRALVKDRWLKVVA